MYRDWKQFIKNEENKAYYIKLKENLDKEGQEFTIFPEKDDVFNAFTLTPISNIKCVIIGQDPYFNKNEAHGLAFSVKNGVKTPPSLRNIYKELEEDLGIVKKKTELTGWAKEGVLLINRVLTVREGEANSHKGLGWEEFTLNVIKEVAELDQPIVFILWGANARSLKKYIKKDHLVLEAPHPSPLSSYRGFFGSKPFSKCNNYLREMGIKEIDWSK